jgi:hypothetical protein
MPNRRQMPPSPPQPSLPGLFAVPYETPVVTTDAVATPEFFGKSRAIDRLNFLHSSRHFHTTLVFHNAVALHDSALYPQEKEKLAPGSYEYRKAIHDRFWTALKKLHDVYPLELPLNTAGWVDEAKALELVSDKENLLERQLGRLAETHVPAPPRANPGDSKSLASAELRPHFRYMREICDAYAADVKANGGAKPHSARLENLSRVLRDFRIALDIQDIVGQFQPILNRYEYQPEATRGLKFSQEHALAALKVAARGVLAEIELKKNMHTRLVAEKLSPIGMGSHAQSVMGCIERVAQATTLNEATDAIETLDNFSRLRAFYAPKNMAHAYCEDMSAINKAEGRERKRSDILSANPFDDESVVARAGFEAAVSLSARNVLHRYRANQKTIGIDDWDKRIADRGTPLNPSGEGKAHQGTVTKEPKGRSKKGGE